MNYFLDSWRPGFHLSPPDGWMSDPVGLCQMNGIYHIFFLYTPGDPTGRSTKVWGHFQGRSLTEMKYEGIAIAAGEYERDGVYPGSALVDEHGMNLFYSGIIRCAPGECPDNENRISNQLLICSEDGRDFSRKTLLLSNPDYPDNLTLMIRDPNVWKENDRYYMVLAAGMKDSPLDDAAAVSSCAAKSDGSESCTDEVRKSHRSRSGNGCTLVYTSKDRIHWDYLKEYYIPEGFGYQWECPDYFHLDSRTVLSVCPQGLDQEDYHFQNHYSAGYFFVEGETRGGQLVRRESFHEWDQGFDFYAPQTFEDAAGRRILLAWAGMPDASYTNLTTDKEGWQGLLTVPRQLSVRNGRILQRPVDEILALRQTRLAPMNGEPVSYENGTGELMIGDGDGSVRVRIGSLLQPNVVTLQYEEGIVTLSLESGVRKLSARAAAAAQAEGAVLAADSLVGREDIAEAAAKASGGRKLRRAKVGALRNLRILVDSSIIEIFINDGEHVMTTRYYPNHKDSKVRMVNAEYGLRSCQSWEYREMDVPFPV